MRCRPLLHNGSGRAPCLLDVRADRQPRVRGPGDHVSRCALRQGDDGRRGRRRAFVNCPMSREEYEGFLDALTTADQHHGHDFDAVPYFEGCMPVEEIARRGRESLRFGPMKPVGLRDPEPAVPRTPWCNCAWRTAVVACGTW
ncbi:MAG: FAD-dependent oxidoreductase [Gemmatimonadaceae bacterium]